MEPLSIGYHGTSTRAVSSIQHDGIRPSTGRGHWLTSNAIYLFEEPSIALGFARSLFHEDAAVFEVLYSTQCCLDLTRYEVALAVSAFGQKVVDALSTEEVADLRQDSGIRQLDDLVLSQIVESTNYKSIKAVFSGSTPPHPSRIFPADRPLWERDGMKSGLNLHSHLQVALLDPGVVRRLRLFDHSGIELD